MSPIGTESKTLTYAEKLRDPRWQRKRLEVMERDGWKCVACGDGSSTLNVHHGHYVRGLDPWEYDNDTLWTTCEACHKAVGETTADLYRELAMLFPWQLETVLGHVVELREATRDGRSVPYGGN